MHEFQYEVDDARDTEALGAALGRTLPAGSVVALKGTLGAGKTYLVGAIASALGVDRSSVVSPTFVLVNQYHGQRTIYHLDAYRLQDDDEFLELGPEEFFDSDGLTLIEWAERVERCLPCERLEVAIEVTGDTSRRFHFRASGDRYEEALDHLREWLAGRPPTDPSPRPE